METNRKASLLSTGNYAILLTVAVLLALPGCRRNEPSYEIVSLERARIDKIETSSGTTGKITVTYYSDKHAGEVTGTGLVTKKTEIMINGAIAQLRDLREGERVNGEVRIDKKGNERTLTALKIYVTRSTTVGGS